MFELSVDTSFAAAHNLCGYEGDCSRVHGHSWKVTVTIAADGQDGIGMCMDFRELADILDTIVASFDHRNLNDLPIFAEKNPTAENLAREIYRQFGERIAGRPAVMKSVTVAESERYRVTYSGS